MRLCEMTIEILEHTNDGRDLFQTEQDIQRHGRNGDGWQLNLLQSAVNNWLKPSGKTLFATLHRQVLTGDYLYPYGDFLAKFCPELLDAPSGRELARARREADGTAAASHLRGSKVLETGAP